MSPSENRQLGGEHLSHRGFDAGLLRRRDTGAEQAHDQGRRRIMA